MNEWMRKWKQRKLFEGGHTRVHCNIIIIPSQTLESATHSSMPSTIYYTHMTCIWNGNNRKIHIFTCVHVRVQSWVPSSPLSPLLQSQNNSNNFISYLFYYALLCLSLSLSSYAHIEYTFHFYEPPFYDYIIITNWLNCFAFKTTQILSQPVLFQE